MLPETEITVASYDKTAQQYAKNVANLQKTAYIELFASLLQPNARILDLACGSGRDAGIFSGKGFSVTGVDLSAELLKIAARNYPNAKFRLMDILELDFEEQSFEGAWSCAGLLHIPKERMPQLVSGVRRVLKPNGLFYMGVKEGEGQGMIKDERYEGDIKKFYSYFKPGELEAVLQAEGFDIVENSGMKRGEAYLKCTEIDILCRKK